MTQESPEIGPDDARAALERVLASAEFAPSPRLRQFLRFVVEESLAGRAEGIKGYAIGVEVYGKDASFDPNSDPLVRVEASRLRKVLGQYYVGSGADDPVRIELPKGAYTPRFVRADGAAPASPESDEAPDIAESEPLPPPPSPRGIWQNIAIATVVSLVIAGLIVGAYELFGMGETPAVTTAESTTGAETGPQSPAPRIAVLPFENLSGDPSKDYIASGLTVEIVTEISRFRVFAVYAVDARPTDASNPAAPSGPLVPAPIAAATGARYTLGGSVRVSGETIRVSAQLVDATGATLWADSFDREMGVEQLIAIEREIAQRIATAIGQPYGVIYEQEIQSIGKMPSTLAGYECVLRAYQCWRTLDRAEHASVRACLESTIATDPEFAAAWYAVTFFYLDEYRYNYNPRPREYRPLDKALEAAQTAVRLAPNLAGSYQALYAALYFRGDLDGFREAGETALRLNPNNPDIMGDFGNRLAIAGDWDRGIALVRQAMELNPGHPGWYWVPLTYDAYRRGDYEAARNFAEQMNMPNFARSWSMLAMIYGELGDRAKAQAAVERLLELDPDFPLNAAEDMRKWGLQPDLIAKCLDGLRKAGLDIGSPSN